MGVLLFGDPRRSMGVWEEAVVGKREGRSRALWMNESIMRDTAVYLVKSAKE